MLLREIKKISRYGKEGFEIHQRPVGSIMTIEFELNGQTFTALNGGPLFQFNEAISLQVYCENQEEIDYYWNKLSEGGDKSAQQCGWLKDQYGLSWQIVPKKFDNVMKVLHQMKKLDIKGLKGAYELKK